MKAGEKVAVYVTLLAAPLSAHAVSEGPPGGGVLFALGFGLGLGTGLLVCWWRCRRKKHDDKPPLK